MACLLGIDLGTTNIKTIVYDAEAARVLAAAEREHAIHQPQPGWAEQNPADWWAAATATVREAVAAAGIAPDAIAGIGLSGQMHGTVLLGADGAPLRPAIIWADTRSRPQVEALLGAGIPVLAKIAPGRPAAGFMGPTLRWLAEHEPETLARTRTAVLPKDALRWMLTGEIAAEPSDAASTWLFDVAAGDWSDGLAELCRVERRILPPARGSADVAGGLTPAAAEALGLRPGIPVVHGAADLPAQALGYGLLGPGRALLTVGTGGQVFHPLESPQTDPDLRYYVFNHAAAGRWYAQAAILAAGLALRWLRDLLGAGDFVRLSTLAEGVPPGAEGLVFLPYLAGERTPHMDPAASGAFVGLRLHHGPGHLARAVMEGVSFALADCLELAAPGAGQIIASGGATKSPVWRQILADALGRPLALGAGAHHACVGAALLAGVGAGVYPDLAAACAALLPAAETITSDPVRAAFYAERRAIYRGLYGTLREDMHALGG